MISGSATDSVLKRSFDSSQKPSSLLSQCSRTQASSLTDSSSEFSIMNFGKKCSICGKNFFLRKKYLCKVCNNYVCGEHFNRIRDKEYVCDKCDTKQAKEEVKKEINKEIIILNEELIKVNENCNRFDREYFDKVSQISKIEHEIKNISDHHENKKMLLKSRLSNEMERVEKNKIEIENSKKTIEEYDLAHEKMTQKQELMIKEMEKIRQELNSVREKNTELTETIKTKTDSSKIVVDSIKEKLCKKCYETLIN